MKLMHVQVSPSLKHVMVFGQKGGKGVKEFIKAVRVVSNARKLSYRTLFYLLLFLTLLLRFVFVMTAMDSIGQLPDATSSDDQYCNNYSLGCLGDRLRPRVWGRRTESQVLEEVYRVLEEIREDEDEGDQLGSDGPQTLEEFVKRVRTSSKSDDARTFARQIKSLVLLMEQKVRTAKIHEYLYRHVASNGVPKPLHCLALRLSDEHATNAAARRPLPTPELASSLVDNSLHHYVIATDNVLAAAVVVSSLVGNSLRKATLVVHVITDRKTFAAMHSWFSLHSVAPAVVEVRSLHQFDWFARGRVPVLEDMEKDRTARSQFRGGSSAIVADSTAAGDNPIVVAAKLQTMSPKYHSVMNHIRIHLPELFPSLKKVVFLDDDVVVQEDLTALWDMDMRGKVNGAVETCRGEDKFVMSKRLKNYLNFSHPLVSENFDPEECAWAYGMNVFDLEAWRKTNISFIYHQWLRKNVESGLNLWQLGTLPPALIAFRGQVRVMEGHWHMLGLGYQEQTTAEEAKKAAVIHFNGRAKPWLDIAFPELRPLWTKYLDFHSDPLLKSCNIVP